MNQVKIGKVYRHFKGNYYFVENVALDSETKERIVVYKPIYDRNDSRDLGKKRSYVFRRNRSNKKRQYNRSKIQI